MVTVAGIKIKAKTKKEPTMSRHGALGEPVWDADRAVCFEDAEFDHYLRKSLNFYNYNNTQKDLKKYVVAWLKENTKWTKEQHDAYALTTPEQTPMTLCSLVKATTMGMPMREKHKASLMAELEKIVAPIVEEQRAERARIAAALKTTKGPVVHAPTIQERLAEKTAEVIGELEGQVDNVFHNLPIEFKIYDFLTSRGVAQSQIGKIRAVFQKQIDEITEFVAGTDKQLNEGYSFLKKADLKRIGDFYVKLMADLESYTAVKKAVKKAKVKKPVAKDKLVAKVKYMKEDKSLKLVSINPVNIVGAKELWCFDTKTRKLIHYVADQYAMELTVKGTTIIGFDTSASVCKTLRKPDEQLKELMKAGKVALRTFMKDIRAVEVRASGRINEHQLLLKVG